MTKQMHIKLCVILSFVIVGLLSGCQQRKTVIAGQPLRGWSDKRVEFEQLADLGYFATYDEVNEKGRKHEICIYMPKILPDQNGDRELSWCLYIDNNIAMSLQLPDSDDRHRVILTVSDDALNHAKLYIAYSRPDEEYGRRHVFTLTSVIESIER